MPRSSSTAAAAAGPPAKRKPAASRRRPRARPAPVPTPAEELLARTILHSGERRKEGTGAWLNVVVDRRGAVDLSLLERVRRDYRKRDTELYGYYFKTLPFRSSYPLHLEVFSQMDGEREPMTIVLDLRGETDKARCESFVRVAEQLARGTAMGFAGREERFSHFYCDGLARTWIVCSSKPDYSLFDRDRWRVWGVREEGDALAVGYTDIRGKNWTPFAVGYREAAGEAAGEDEEQPAKRRALIE